MSSTLEDWQYFKPPLNRTAVLNCTHCTLAQPFCTTFVLVIFLPEPVPEPYLSSNDRARDLHSSFLK